MYQHCSRQPTFLYAMALLCVFSAGLVIWPRRPYILQMVAMICLVIDLLYDGAAAGKDIKKGFKPVLTKEEYLRECGRLE